MSGAIEPMGWCVAWAREGASHAVPLEVKFEFAGRRVPSWWVRHPCFRAPITGNVRPKVTDIGALVIYSAARCTSTFCR